MPGRCFDALNPHARCRIVFDYVSTDSESKYRRGPLEVLVDGDVFELSRILLVFQELDDSLPINSGCFGAATEEVLEHVDFAAVFHYGRLCSSFATVSLSAAEMGQVLVA